MSVAFKRSLLLALVAGSLAAPGTAVASERVASSGEHVSRATGTSQAAGFRDDRGNMLTFVLDAMGIGFAGTAAIFGLTRLLPTGSRPRIALP
jgi:hypothetical protein